MIPRWYDDWIRIYLIFASLAILFIILDANLNLTGYFDSNEKRLSRVEKNLNNKQKEDKIKIAEVVFQQISEEEDVVSLSASLGDGINGLCVNYDYFNRLNALEKEKDIFDPKFYDQVRKQKLFRAKNIYDRFINDLKRSEITFCNQEKDRFSFFVNILDIIEHHYIPFIADLSVKGAVIAEFRGYSKDGSIRDFCLTLIKADISEKLVAIKKLDKDKDQKQWTLIGQLDEYVDSTSQWNFSKKEMDIPEDIIKKLDSLNTEQ